MQSRIAVLNQFFKILTKFRLYFFEIQLRFDLFSSRNLDSLLVRTAKVCMQNESHKLTTRYLIITLSCMIIPKRLATMPLLRDTVYIYTTF